jgi:hypothetical protein
MRYTTALGSVAGVFLIMPLNHLYAQGPPPGGGPASTTQPTTTELLQEIRLLREQMQQQDQRHEAEVKQLQAQIDEIKHQQAATATAAVPAPGPPATAPAQGAEAELESLLAGAAPPPSSVTDSQPAGVMGTLQRAIQSLNPDISLNGDFLGAYSSREGGKLDDEFLFRELEIGFSGAVDPYTKATMIVTVSQEDHDFKVDLEEAYLTFLQLPYGLQARAGVFRADFGKTYPIHLHALPWTDYPFVIKRYFGDEGLFGTGAEVSWLPPIKSDLFFSIEYEVFNNDNDTLFAGEESDDFVHLVHAKTFKDLTTSSNIELGASIATAPNNGGHGGHRSTVEGVDLTYRWKPKGAGLYRSFLWQTEFLAAQADHRGGTEDTWGAYSAAEYQFARQWKLGLRYDATELPFDSSLHERGYSAYLTFLQSEFVFWRLAYIYTDRNFREHGDESDQQLVLQLNWTLGAHPAHKF